MQVTVHTTRRYHHAAPLVSRVSTISRLDMANHLLYARLNNEETNHAIPRPPYVGDNVALAVYASSLNGLDLTPHRITDLTAALEPIKATARGIDPMICDCVLAGTCLHPDAAP